MRKNWKNNTTLVIAMWTIILLSSCNRHVDHAETYTCPMHPTVLSDKPGACPVCGMDLVRKTRAGEEVEITENLTKVLKSPNEVVVSSIKTINASYKSMPLSIVAQGMATYDPRTITIIATRVGGRIEKLFLKYPFQPIAKGQKVAEIYSPELVTAQRELLSLLQNDAQNTELIQSAKNKIAWLGVSQVQINTLIQQREVLTLFSVYSSHTGYLITSEPTRTNREVSTAKSEAEEKMNGMRSSTPSTGSAINEEIVQETLLREGDYVSPRQTLFKMANPSSLRIEIDLPASQGGSIKKGTHIQLDISDGKRITTTIDFIQPFFTDGEKFIKLIAYTGQTEGLRIGQLVKAQLTIPSSESLWIPSESIVDLGLTQVVFIKTRGAFKPITVATGITADGWTEIKHGLTTGDEIANTAQYLVDSESFVKTH